MLRKHRGFFVSTVLISLAVSLAGASWYFNPWYVPDPDTSSQARLLTWLAVNDAAQQPRPFQVALVDRFQHELEAGTLALGTRSDRVVPSRFREQMAANARHLKRVWFETRAAQYAECSQVDRFPFLGRQIEAIEKWSSLQRRGSADARETRPVRDPPLPIGSSGLALFREVDGWIVNADPTQRPVLRRALNDTLVWWMAHRDLEAQPLAARMRLARSTTAALSERLRPGPHARSTDTSPREIASTLDGLNDAQRQQLTSNAMLLIEAWLHDLAERYDNVAQDARFAFIDERLKEVKAWNAGRWIEQMGDRGLPIADSSTAVAASPPFAQGTAANGIASLLQNVDGFVDRAPADRQPQLERFVRDTKQRVAWRALHSAMPSGIRF